MNANPPPTITRADLGWLVACPVKGCDFERHAERRPAADRVAFDHRRTHGEVKR